MKHNRYATLIFVMFLATMLLSACSGAGAANSWPGVTVADDNIYAAFNNHVYSINPGNGSKNWQFPADAGKVAYFASPLVLNDMVVVGDFDHSLHALNKANGIEQWVFAEAKGRWISGLATVGNVIIAPNSDREIYGLSMNGEKQWMFPTSGQNWAQPTTDGKYVYVSSMDHFVYALDPANKGQRIWATDLGGAVIHSQIQSDDGTLYLGTLGNELIAVDSKNGKILWRGKTAGGVWGKAVLGDKIVYVGDQAGKITAFDTASGHVLWSQDAGGPVIGAGTLSGDNLIFGTENGSLVSFDPSGKKLWTVTVSGKLYSDMLFAGDKIIGAAIESDKNLQAFDKDGKEIWFFTPAK